MYDYEYLKSIGYKQIKSEAHAYQITRRLLKQMRRESSRNGNFSIPDYRIEVLMQIKPGSWYRIGPRRICTKKPRWLNVIKDHPTRGES